MNIQTISNQLQNKVVTSFDFKEQYVKLNDVVDIVELNILESYKENSSVNPVKETHEIKAIFNAKDLIKYFFTRKVLIVALVILFAMNLDLIAMSLGYAFEWAKQIKTLLKIAFVIPIAIATSHTLNYAFKDMTNDNEDGVPSPRTVIYYVTQSWLMYILLATGLTIYNFNLESIGIENLSDFVATFNTITSLLALVQFILWRWFRKYYEFIFSTIENTSDINSTFDTIPSLQKTYISILLIIGLLWITKDIFLAFASH